MRIPFARAGNESGVFVKLTETIRLAFGIERRKRGQDGEIGAG